MSVDNARAIVALDAGDSDECKVWATSLVAKCDGVSHE